MQEINSAYIAKTPIQARSKERVKLILQAAEILILEQDVNTISHHKIAKQAKVSPASVYQYFPTLGALFSTLAEEHFLKAFEIVSREIENTEICNWQNLADIMINGAYEFYTRDKISEILFLRVHLAPGVREQTASRLTRLGTMYCAHFLSLYHEADLHTLPEKLAICVDIMKTVYIRSIALHGKIKPVYLEECRLLVIGYLGSFFEGLDKRS
jgi:AcrR family transcriptional regulator